MGKTNIEWTEETWTPLKGCRRISPGCGGPDGGGCYAERMGRRLAGPGGAYEGLVKSTAEGPRWTGVARVDEATLLEPLSWRKPRMVFVDSMSDLFFEGFTDQEIARVYAVMAATPHVTYQVLTKRAERAADLLSSELFEGLVVEAGERLAREHGWCHANEGEAWPLPNVWQGVSCENRKHGLPRLEHLRRTPAAVRFVSFEPLLEDLGEVDLSGIHWAVIGGESGPRARPCDLEWIRYLLHHCREQNVAPFVKQVGKAVCDSFYDPARAVLLKHPKGGDPSEWDEHLRVREFPEVPRGS